MKKKNPVYVRDFTIGIPHCKITDAVVGTGFVVSPDGKIITCSHVLRDAGVELDGQNFPELDVRFPQRKNRKSETRKAKVVAYMDSDRDDVVLLQLTDGPSPLGPEDVARLGIAEDSLGREFISFGYRRVDNYKGLPAYGKIVGFCDIDENANLLCDRVMLSSTNIDSGMSGAPVAVLDEDNDAYRVVGIIAQTYDPAKSQKDRDTSFAVDASVFTYEPFKVHIDIHLDMPALSVNPMPKTDISLASKAISPNLDVAWNDAPLIPDHWVARDELMDAMIDCWKEGKTRLISLIGPDGGGKTTLARKWADDLLSSRWQELPKPKGTFWWSFKDKPNVEEFFESALNYMSEENIDQSQFRSTNAKMDFLAAMIFGMERQDCCLFILDGLDALQHQQRDEFGSIKSEELRQFITYLALFGHCLATSSILLLDYAGHPSHAQHNITRLSNMEGRELLRKLGVKGSDDELDKVVNDYNGQPLMLNLIGKYFVELCGGAVKKIG